jgi:5-methylcytosine-specific restriction endonuclease McrA
MAYVNKEDRNANQLRHYYRRREWMIDYLGWYCKDCGGAFNLEIDHIDPADKSFNISSAYSLSIEVLVKELEKCCLRCDECHKKKTVKEDGFEAQHGTGGMYRHHGCRCELCRAANRQYSRDYAARKKAAGAG